MNYDYLLSIIGPTSPTSAMRVSHTEGCPTSESYTSTLDTSFNLHSDDDFATQSRFLRIDDLSSALNNDNVQKLFNVSNITWQSILQTSLTIKITVGLQQFESN